MQIRRGGIAASRASTWPRRHFLPWQATSIEANDMERILAKIMPIVAAVARRRGNIMGERPC
jgi:hypothetical protein